MRFVFLSVLFGFFLPCVGQQKHKITGIILDEDNVEPVSFAPIQFKASGIGKIANQDGTFDLVYSDIDAYDTLVCSYIGYEAVFIPVRTLLEDSTQNKHLRILLKKSILKKEVLIKSKYSKSFLLWRKVIRHKEKNNPDKIAYYRYHLNNRLELGLNQLNKQKLEESKVFRKFRFLTNSLDSSEFHQLTLPFFITEIISDVYAQKSPYKKREEIHAVKTSGIKNESVIKLLGNTSQGANIYNNQITFFNRELISPFADNADFFYNFKILDTQYALGQRLIHFLFLPKTFSENVLEGDCWIRDTLYAIQKINLRLGKEAGVNFIQKANLTQEFSLINDTTYFLKRAYLVAEISPTKEIKPSFLFRSHTMYQQVKLDTPQIRFALAKNKEIDESVLEDSAQQREESYFVQYRNDTLKRSEQLAYQTIDTLWKMPTFVRMTRVLELAQSGYWELGWLRVGKWWNLVGRNPYNGYRVRLELGNNTKLSKNFYIHTTLSLNQKNGPILGGIEWKYIFNHQLFSEFSMLSSKYIDLGFYDNQSRLLSEDNVFVNILKRPQTTFQLHEIWANRITYQKELFSGVSLTIKAEHNRYTPLVRNSNNSTSSDLNEHSLHKDLAYISINTCFTAEWRYSYQEKHMEYNFERLSLGSKYPILKLSYTKGFSGLMNSQFDYHQFNLHLQYTLKKQPFGTFKLNTNTGFYLASTPLPSLLLERPYANLTMYDLPNTFCTVQPFEFASDSYLKLHLVHHLGVDVFQLIPIVRRWKWRQLWSLNAMYGTLNTSNHSLLQNSKALPTKDLSSTPLIEIGTGIDNILHLLRVSYFWRLTNNEGSRVYQTFMFSIRLQF